jgi:anti-anti-sigma factor
MKETPPLEADIQYLSSRRVRVALAGALNSDSATMARQVFDSAVAAGYTEVEVDAHALSLGDVQGLDVLESAQLECAEHEGLLLLLDAPPMVRRILAATGLESLLLNRD